MDELERDLRATFDHLADGAAPSAGLVGRTRERSVAIRRRRRVLTASGLAGGALAVTLLGASIAGAGTRGQELRVSNPAGVELPAASSTTTSTTTTTSAPPVRPTRATPATPRASTTMTTTTTLALPGPCHPAVVDDTVERGVSSGGGTFTLLANGDITVAYDFSSLPPPRRYDYFVLDDGARGDGFTQSYLPAEFGRHWYDEWIDEGLGQYVGCRTRHYFDVDPATAAPEPPPGTTTVPVTVAPESTTATTTTIG